MMLMSGNATEVPTGPPSPASTTGTPVTFPIKRCCGILADGECDCRQFAAEARGVFAQPIMCRPASEWTSSKVSPERAR
jgi:hypothetical protein